MDAISCLFFFFFFNDTATTEIYTLSLHDALPISARGGGRDARQAQHDRARAGAVRRQRELGHVRSEEHTSELQSRSDLVCRLLLGKKKKQQNTLDISAHHDSNHNSNIRVLHTRSH